MYLPSSFFSTGLFWSILQWFVICLVWLAFTRGMWAEDKRVKLWLKRGAGDETARHLMQSLHRRDIQIWIQVSILLVVVAANDIHHDKALLPADYFSAPAAVPQVATEEAPAPAHPMEKVDDTYDKAIKSSTPPGLPFADITEFNEQNGKQEAYIDWLKERYEAWLVTYYYLQKCKAAGDEDYAIIHNLLKRDLESTHAKPEVERNILLAANGSYKEIYSNIPCDNAQMRSTKASYDANMQQARAPHNDVKKASGAVPATASPAKTR